MNVKNIIKVVALAMLMPAMMLNSACSNEDEPVIGNENAPSRGYPLYVSVNATRQGDEATTRAEFGADNKLHFTAGDQLFVKGSATGAGSFAGTLDYVPATGKFSGTIYTELGYSGTAQELFGATMTSVTAYLIPDGYGKYFYLGNYSGNSYNDNITFEYPYAFAETKKLAVEQLSYEQGGYDKTNKRFVLNPFNAILNFTITGLAASTEVEVVFNDGTTEVNHRMSTNASGTATFAIGVPGYVETYSAGTNLNTCTLTVAGNPITLVSSDKTLTAGKIYNITRNAIPGALVGKFSVSSTDKVYFSKGNLQYTKSTGIWSFMDHQYSTVETLNQNVGDDYASQDVVSLFGWGTSGWNNGNTYYQPYNTAYVSSSGSSKGYGYGPKNGSTYTYDLTGTYANADWGHNAISNGGNTADTWRTLTKDEWTYLFNTRSASTVNGTADARYAKAYLFGTTHGVIIFPDVYTHPAGVTAPTGINATSYTSWDGNRYTATDWVKMEAAGCVFLPAAGWRDATTIRKVNEYVRYWTSTYYNAGFANNVGIAESSMNPADYNQKNYGYSVRLVHDAN